jgi:crotonobetainyl-CoA hydratase
VIAAVNGLAVGGGFELALACDLIVAARDAQMWVPEVQLGFVSDAGGVFRLPERLPRALALELLLTGRRLGAEEAARWGLVNRVVEPGGALEGARELAAPILDAAPLAIRAVKAIVAATAGRDVREGSRRLREGEIPAYDRALASEDADEGPRAFAEGRDPIWKGR